MYSLLRSVLFCLPPEVAHQVALHALTLGSRLGLRVVKPVPELPVQVMGLRFKNPVGLAAGFDKNGDYLETLATLGFGFVEIGTVTPKPQLGNPKPRLFRLPKDRALINRMGFNNKGVDYVVQKLRNRRYNGVLGVNIGKNRTTSLKQAPADYLLCLEKIYPHADYVTINISSPNTPGLRNLQLGDTLKNLLTQLKDKQAQLASLHGRYVPIALKVAPDLTEKEISTIAKLLLDLKIDALIATNTTISRELVSGSLTHEQGGLSGKPLGEKSTAIIAAFAKILQKKIPIIGVGGVFTVEDARQKRKAGAELIQIYSALIYEGPNLVNAIARGLQRGTPIGMTSKKEPLNKA